MKKLILPACLALGLFGCDGDSDSSGTPGGSGGAGGMGGAPGGAPGGVGGSGGMAGGAGGMTGETSTLRGRVDMDGGNQPTYDAPRQKQLLIADTVAVVDASGEVVATGEVNDQMEFVIEGLAAIEGAFTLQATAGAEVVFEALVPTGIEAGEDRTVAPLSAETTAEARAYLALVAEGHSGADIDTIGLITRISTEIAAHAHAEAEGGALLAGPVLAAQAEFIAALEAEGSSDASASALVEARAEAYAALEVALDAATDVAAEREAWARFHADAAAAIDADASTQAEAESSASVALQISIEADASAVGRLSYGVACLHGKAGRAEEALAALEAASRTGWTEAAHTARDADLALIRGHPRFEAALAEMRRSQRRLKVYEVLVWENADLPMLHIRFDRMNFPKAKVLRDEFALDALVKDAPDQLTAHKAVLAWVHNRWSHSGLNEPVSPNALDILRAVQKGARFRCVEYSVVLAQALNALGDPARVVSLRSEGMSYGTGKGHVISEVWNDDLGQWVALDGQNNAIWTHEGRPLSSREIQMLHHEGKADAVQLEHGGSTWMAKAPNREAWLAYFHAIQLAKDNRIFDAQAGASKGKQLLIAAGMTPELLFQGSPLKGVNITADAAPLYPKLNRVHVQVTPDGATLKCTLSHNMPSFRHYEINGVVSKVSDYAWALSPGENTLEIRAVNHRGVKGAPTRLRLVYHP